MRQFINRSIVLTFFLINFSLSAADNEINFVKGNEEYKKGNFQEALDVYRQILDSGKHSSSLYFNMGNCYYKLQDIGHSVLYYEKALKLKKGDEDILANLAIANLAVVDRITPLEKHLIFKVYNGFVFMLNRRALLLSTATAYLLAMLFLIILIISRNSGLRFISRRVSLICAVFFLIFGLALLGQISESRNQIEAVILAEKVNIKSAPSDEGTMNLFTLHEGAKVRVDQSSGDWVEIVLADGKVGWVLKANIEII